jgi:class 3 adenylate cyclase
VSTIEVIGLIATVVAILGTISAITLRFISERNARIEQKMADQSEHYTRMTNELLAKQSELIQTIGSLKTTSGTGITLKSEIDDELQQLEHLAKSSASSILVPFPPSRDTKFVFLSITGPEREKLKKTLLDVHKGVAGYVYKNGDGTYINDPSSDPRWYGKVDKRIDFRTENILCLPLIYENKTIGVVQFLNKMGGFVDEDLPIMSKYILSLAAKVKEFAQSIDNFELLGLAYSKDDFQGSILVADLTASSSLLKRAHPMPMTEVVNLINDYLETLSVVGFDHNGIIDKFMWDGFIVNFNVSKKIGDFPVAAVESAFEMMQAFNELKNSWLRYGFPVERIFNRIAVSTGTVHEVHMGPPQFRQRTVIGDPVVIASTVNAFAPRTQNVLTIDTATYEYVSHMKLNTTKLSKQEMGKAYGLIQEAYRIQYPISSHG